MESGNLESLLPEHLRKDLSDAEHGLLAGAPRGIPTTVLDPHPDKNEPAESEQWPPARTVRAELLVWLYTNPTASKSIHPRGVSLEGAHIKDHLDLKSCTLDRPLKLKQCGIHQGMCLDYARTRTTRITSCVVKSLSADSARIDGDLFLSSSHFAGELNLIDTNIDGALVCFASKLIHPAAKEDPNARALNADRLTTKGSVFLPEIKTEGEVRLVGADIGGQLNCRGASLLNPKGLAFNGEVLVTKGPVLLDGGFSASGTVDINSADIGDDLILRQATIKCRETAPWLSLSQTSIKGSLTIAAMGERPKGWVDLRNASVARHQQDDDSFWPEKGKLLLDGFTYERIEFEPFDVKRFCEWIGLRRIKPFSVQPYEQLARVLRVEGHESDARAVLIAKQEALRIYGQLGWKARAWNWFLGLTIGHGYQPWRAAAFIGWIIVFGWLMFADGARYHDVMRPSKERVYMAMEANPGMSLPNDYPRFNSLIYSIDSFIPFVNLHQENYWLPVANRPFGLVYRGYLWLHIAAGWIFSTLFVAALTGLVRKD